MDDNEKIEKVIISYREWSSQCETFRFMEIHLNEIGKFGVNIPLKNQFSFPNGHDYTLSSRK